MERRVTLELQSERVQNIIAAKVEEMRAKMEEELKEGIAVEKAKVLAEVRTAEQEKVKEKEVLEEMIVENARRCAPGAVLHAHIAHMRTMRCPPCAPRAPCAPYAVLRRAQQEQERLDKETRKQDHERFSELQLAELEDKRRRENAAVQQKAKRLQQKQILGTKGSRPKLSFGFGKK